MKKLILIALLTLFNINFVNSDFKNQEYSNIEKIEKNIYNIENRIKEIQSNDVESRELIELQHKLWDYIYKLNIKKWNSIHYKDLIENKSKFSQKTSNQINNFNSVPLETWDIILISFKNKPWWSFFTNWWEHAWVVSDEKSSPLMVYPIELALSDNAWTLYSVNF